jgi:ubiquinone/menaquinone biosynthesis C-methylase UbiE
MFYILFVPGKSMNSADKWKLREFFKTGDDEIQKLLKEINKSKINISKKVALDFGCGIGRLSSAMSKHFEKVIGVDIAPSMIKQAQEYNVNNKKCTFILNTKSNLGIFPNNYFDFIYSNITLQHINPKYSTEYIKEFTRILKPKGLLVFQLPAQKTFLIKIREILRIILKPKSIKMEMHCIPRKQVEQIISSTHCKIVKVINNIDVGKGWISFTYFIQKY